MQLPRIEPFESIGDASRFLAFADDASARLRRFWPVRTGTAVLRGASVPAALDGADERLDVAAALRDLGRLTDVACGTGIAVAFAYPGHPREMLASGVDLERARLAWTAGTPAVHATFCACVADDRTVFESFRFAALAPHGVFERLAPREELALAFAFREAAGLAVASLRDVLGDERRVPADPAFAPLLERIGSRARAYLERAVHAREIAPAPGGATCEASVPGAADCGGPRFALRGDTFAAPEADGRARCVEHLAPLLHHAARALVELGIRSDAWFAERGAGVLVTVDCETCGRRSEVPAIVTDRCVVTGERATALGFGSLFERAGSWDRPRACCALRATGVSSAELSELVATDRFGPRLRLAWTCDVRAFVARGEAACALAFAADGTSGASRLFDLAALRAPRFDRPALVRATALENR